MANINFVPDDYIQNNESQRTNLIYLFLFLIVMAGLTGAFLTIKFRQNSFEEKEKLVNEKMKQAQETIEQFEKLQTKRKAMMKTALTTAELVESIPKSVLLAALTNDLPSGMSLLDLSFEQKMPRDYRRRNVGHKNGKSSAASVSPEKLLETDIAIEGIAPSDLEVAAYIERLNGSMLLEMVALVESKEHKTKNSTEFRKFKLTAKLKKDIHLTKEDINQIRAKKDMATVNF